MERGSASRVAGVLAGDLWKWLRAALRPYSRGELAKRYRQCWDDDLAFLGRRSKESRELFDLTGAGDAGLDDKTWFDLDLPALFEQLDFTATDVGQNVLYRQLRQPSEDEGALRSRYSVAVELRDDHELREQLLIELHALSSSDVVSATRLLFGTREAAGDHRLRMVCWFLGMTIFSAATLMVGGWLWYAAFPVLILNFAACQLFVARAERLSYGYHVLYQLLCVAERMSSRGDFQTIPVCAFLASRRDELRRLRRRCYLLAFSQASPNLLMAQPMYLVNLVTAIEPLLYSLNTARLGSEMQLLRDVYESVGAVDASIAVARYLRRFPEHCNPELSDEAPIRLVGTYHPLIADPVPNEFDSAGRSAMVTGSNMAGKTSFIKTIGVNVLLARTLFLCHAQRAVLPWLDVATSIKTEDGIQDGRSFYFAELERLLEFLRDSSDPGRTRLLLVDEIYRGTNTVERIAGAAAVLMALSERDTVLVTTHDVELAGFLAERFHGFYFEETGCPENPFDYRLKPGVCSTRNALTLMANVGYPESIVRRARAIAEQLDSPRQR